MAEAAERDAEPRPTGKSPAAFRTIAEVASELDLPQHVLRFWESKFPQIRPLKRGGGRRYYRPQDVELLRRIRHLLYSEGYTIRGAQRLLRQRGPRSGAALSDDDAALQQPLPSKSRHKPLDPKVRAELETALDELEQLRRLLRSHRL